MRGTEEFELGLIINRANATLNVTELKAKTKTFIYKVRLILLR